MFNVELHVLKSIKADTKNYGMWRGKLSALQPKQGRAIGKGEGKGR